MGVLWLRRGEHSTSARGVLLETTDRMGALQPGGGGGGVGDQTEWVPCLQKQCRGKQGPSSSPPTLPLQGFPLVWSYKHPVQGAPPRRDTLQAEWTHTEKRNAVCIWALVYYASAATASLCLCGAEFFLPSQLTEHKAAESCLQQVHVLRTQPH